MVMSPQVSWAVFQGASEAPISGFIRVKRATRKNSQLAAARRVALKMAGGRVARRLRINLDMRPPRALPTAHFERNDVIIICETVALGVRKVIVRWRYVCVVVDRCLNQCRSVSDPPGCFKSRTHVLWPCAGETDPAARFSEAHKVNRLQLGAERWNT